MSDNNQLKIIIEDGVSRWNKWRAENPAVNTDISGAELLGKYLQKANFRGTKLSGANLQGADLRGSALDDADLTECNLDKANLHDASLRHAILNKVTAKGATFGKANLEGAIAEDANFQNAIFNQANLSNANLRRAIKEDAQFSSATFNSDTLGLGDLTAQQRSVLVESDGGFAPTVSIADVDDFPEDDGHGAQRSDSPTVAAARVVFGNANIALQVLVPPNDFSDEDRVLFEQLRASVAEFEVLLNQAKEENRVLASENETLRAKVDSALPLWKKAWEKFVVGTAAAAGGMVGQSAGLGAAYHAGFIAGMLHVYISSGGPGLDA